MRILLLGATGFLGRHLSTALLAAGHQLLACARHPGPPLPGLEWRQLELPGGLAEFAWPEGVDLLINAVGELSDDAGQLWSLQRDAACALFDLAAAHGARVVQISALGAGEQADVPFLASKGAADDYLLGLGIPALVLRPSLLLGAGGASSGWLQRLSPWPLIPVLDNRARLQPLHVDDFCAALLALLRAWPATPQVVPLVGPQALTQGQLLDLLRAAQGWAPGRYWQLPGWLCGALAALGQRCRWRALSPQTRLLAGRDNLAEAGIAERLCGWRAAPLASRLEHWPDPARSLLEPMRALALAVLLLIWLGTAVVCLGPGHEWGLRIMAELGVEGWPARLAVLAGGVLDGLLGLGLLWSRWRRRALQGQLLLVLGYSLFISVYLPHYWADPYMALGKNLAVLLLVLWLLWLPAARRPA